MALTLRYFAGMDAPVPKVITCHVLCVCVLTLNPKP
jgi:hypothetical protein